MNFSDPFGSKYGDNNLNTCSSAGNQTAVLIIRLVANNEVF